MFAAIRVEYSEGSRRDDHCRSQGDRTKVGEVEKSIRDYKKYVGELWKRFPSSYHKMKEFMQRGSCRCGPSASNFRELSCECANEGKLCICSTPSLCQCCPSHCDTRNVEQTVRVYDINTSADNWEDFLVADTFNPSDQCDLNNFKAKLAPDILPKQRPVFSDENLSEEKDANEILQHPQQCRVITVSHLSPEVVQLLGGVYDIAADFFNRHLPGTEAISGRLISRLPSTVQIDFDELYEGEQSFPHLFNQYNADGKQGHHEIEQAIGKNFLFKTGWDYFPISQRDFQASRNNSSLSSGYEVLMQDDLKNVFQFNLAHRISIYSQPPCHPRTAIIIFYPMLHMQYEVKDDAGHLSTKPIDFRSVPNILPSPSELQKILADRKDWETEGVKQSFASAFDTRFQMHIKEHYDGGHPRCDNKIDHATFVHMFASPLFKMIGANLARLIVRRSFDLDLLEWRPKERVNSRAIDEIKSRRIAIARHQRDIKASLEVLRALMLEENGQLQAGAITEGAAAYNLARSNALIAKETNDDTWESIFWDFFELKASIDALEKRADKIQEGLIGLIQVYGGEKSGEISNFGFFLSAVLVPFSIMGSIWSAGVWDRNEEGNKANKPVPFWLAVGVTGFVIAASIQCYPALKSLWFDYVAYKLYSWRGKVLVWLKRKWYYKELEKTKSRWQVKV